MGGNEPLLGLHPTQDPHIAGAGGGGGGTWGERGFVGGNTIRRLHSPGSSQSLNQLRHINYSLSVLCCKTTLLSGG